MEIVRKTIASSGCILKDRAVALAFLASLSTFPWCDRFFDFCFQLFMVKAASRCNSARNPDASPGSIIL
jgi:hypothetical protein